MTNPAICSETDKPGPRRTGRSILVCADLRRGGGASFRVVLVSREYSLCLTEAVGRRAAALVQDRREATDGAVVTGGTDSDSIERPGLGMG